MPTRDFIFSMQGYRELDSLEKNKNKTAYTANRIFNEFEINDMPSNIVFGALPDDPKYHLHFLANSGIKKLSPSEKAIRIASEIGLELEKLDDTFTENLKKRNVLLGIHRIQFPDGKEQYTRALYIPYKEVIIYLARWDKEETAVCIIPTDDLNKELRNIKIENYVLSLEQEELTKQLADCMERISDASSKKIKSDKFYDALCCNAL